MTYFIFVGDMLVMLFMVCLVVWVSLKNTKKINSKTARIPLEDEQHHG